MHEIEVAELSSLIEVWLMSEPKGYPASVAVQHADRLATILAGQAPRSLRAEAVLARFHWQRSWELPAEAAIEALRSAVNCAAALPPEQLETLPPGLRTLIDVVPVVTHDMSAIGDAALAAATNMDRRILLLRIAAQIAVPNRERVFYLTHLSSALLERFQRYGDADDLNAAITTSREVLPFVNELSTSGYTVPANLALMLRKRFQRRGSAADLNDSVVLGRQAAAMEHDDPTVTSSLALTLRLRFEIEGREDDLDEAITMARRAVGLIRPEYHETRVVLSNLAYLLSYRNHLSDLELDEAIHIANDAAAPLLEALNEGVIPTEGQDTLMISAELLCRRFGRRKDLRDLDDAVTAADGLLLMSSPGGPYRLSSLRLSRNVLMLRGIRGGGPLADVTKAVGHAREVLAAGETVERDDRLRLAALLSFRFNVTEDISDVAALALTLSDGFQPLPGREHPLSGHARRILEQVAATGNSEALLDELLNAEEASLRNIPLGSALDLRAACLFGWIVWLRAMVRAAPENAERDIHLAALLFSPVYRIDPVAVPGQLAEVFDTVAEPVSDTALVTDADPVADQHVDDAERLNLEAMHNLSQFENNNNVAAGIEAVRLLRLALRSAQAAHDLDLEALVANNLAVVLGGLPDDLIADDERHEAVRVARHTVELTAPDHYYLPGRLSNLCGTLLRLYAATKDPHSLDEAITAGRHSVEKTEHKHPSIGMYWLLFARALSSRPHLTSDQQDEVAAAYRCAVDLLPGVHRVRHVALLEFAMFVYEAGVTADPFEIMSALQEAATTGDEDLCVRVLTRLILFLRDHPSADQWVPELREAVDAAQQLLVGIRQTSLHAKTLAILLAETVRRSDTLLSDQAAVRRVAGSLLAHGRAESPVNRDDPLLLAQVGLQLLQLADVLDDQSARSRALGMLRYAVAATDDDDPGLIKRQGDLVEGLRNAYLATRDIALLREEIALSDSMVERTRDGDPELLVILHANISALTRLWTDVHDDSRLDDWIDRAVRASRCPESTWNDRMSKAIALIQHAWVRGDQEEMGAGIRMGREAILAADINDPRRQNALNEFAGFLAYYYVHTGATEILDEAVAAARNAVEGDSGESWPGYSNSLAQILLVRFGAGGDVGDLRECIQLHRQAVAAVSVGLPYRPLYLDCLRYALSVSAEFDGDIGLLMEAADCGRAAWASAVSGKGFRSQAASGLAEVLLALFHSTGESAFLTEAHSVLDDALDVGQSQPETYKAEHALARILVAESAKRIEPVNPDDRLRFQQARDILRRLALSSSGTRNDRFTMMSEWADLAMALHDPHDAVRACESAIELVLMNAGRALRHTDRERGLSQSSWLPKTAAAAAIAAGDPERAVELLEQARGILMADTLHDRQDISSIRAADPSLADEYLSLRAGLAMSEGDETTQGLLSGVQSLQDRTALERRWRQVVDEIRELPGQTGFLQALSIDSLQSAIAGNTVVLNVSRWRSDALILDGSTVTVVGLPDLTEQEVVDRTNAYLSVLHDVQSTRANLIAALAKARETGLPAAINALHATREDARRKMAAMEKTSVQTLAWLWTAAAQPVLHHLGYTTAHSTSDQLPRVWWCPTGPLALLPIHAAGSSEDSDESVIKRAVSSYTPTVRAFQATEPHARGRNEDRLLVVAMPDTEGQSALPGAAVELDLLRGIVAEPARTVIEGQAATRDAVRRELSRHSWIHFSCHGDQDLKNPSRGGIMLADGVLSVLDIMRTPQWTELTFLSACKTATIGIRLADEAMTLATAMHYAGSRHVIGALWSVYDSAAAQVVNEFYRQVFGSGRPNADDAARALHRATTELRRKHPDYPSAWIPFIHIGP